MTNFFGAHAAIHSTFWLSAVSPFSIALLLKALASGFFVSLLFSRSSRDDVDESLTQNARLFSAFMDNLPAFAWIKDIEGRYVYVNKLLMARVTASQSKWLGKTDADLWSGEIGATYRANDLKVIASRETLETVEPYLLEGQQHYLLVTRFPMLDHTGAVTMIGGTGADITAHQRAEDSLPEAEKKYRDIFENAVEGIFQSTPDGHFITANPALARMLGYDSTEELLGGRTDIARQHYVEPALRLKFKQMLEEDGVVRDFEHRAYRKDGCKIWLSENVRSVCDVNGAVLYYEGFTEDITARKQAEEERDRLFNLSLDPLCVAGFDGYFKQVSPAWTQTLGWSEVELLSRPWIEFVHPDDHEATVKAGDALASNQSALGFENRYQHKDGSYRWFSWNAFPLSKAQRIYAVARDITERRRAAELLQTFPRRLIEAQEEERKRIARELHDEIGQVLTAISLNLQAVRASGLTTPMPKIDESILVVDDALQHVQNLALELRPSLLDDLGLAAAIRWFVDRYAQRTGIKVEVTMDVQIADGRLSRELETACFRIVQEALTNVARHAEAQTVSIHLRALSDEICISIRDDGVGFDASAGNGATPIRLGLRGMEERALALGGKLEIKSAPATGTEILAHFPSEKKKD